MNALTQSAPNVADVKDGITKGELYDADITDDVLQAVEILNQIKADGGTIRAYLSQLNILDEHITPAARKLLRFFGDNLNSAKKIRELIGAYNDTLRAQGNPNQGDVFGDKVTVDKNQLLDKVLKDHGQQQSELDNSGRTENGQSARYEKPIGAPDNETQGRPDSGRGDAQSNRTSGAQGQSERGRIDRGQPKDLTLTGQTEAEIAHTEAQIKLAEKQRELAEKKLEAQRAQDELHKTITQRNDAANDGFTLGQSADDNVSGQDAMFSRSADTQAKYEARIDELFNGKPAGRVGVTVLDKSDVLDMLGYGGKPVVLQESKVIRGMDAHQAMTADVWKKIPDWIENPVAVFKSDTVDGRLVFVAPEMVAGSPALIIIEPNADISGELNAHLMVNAYSKDNGRSPFGRWVRDGMLKYVNKQKFPVFASRVGLQLSEKDLQNKQGSERILTEKNLSGYRKSQQSVHPSSGVGQKTTGNTVTAIRQNIAKMFGVTDLSGLPNLSVMQSVTPEVLAKIDSGQYSIIGEKGAANIDRAEEVTHRLDNLQVAREMRDAGKDAYSIKFATGWEYAPDGWRYETVDDYLSLSNYFKLTGNDPYGYTGKIDVLLSKDLNNAYPNLGNIRAEIAITKMVGRNGSFEAIKINGRLDENHSTIKIYAPSVQQAQSILIHEIQHAIQAYEGFNQGANLKQVGADNYHRSAGEVEARNAQKRMYDDASTKRKYLLSNTEDVSPVDKLYLSRSNAQTDSSNIQGAFDPKTGKIFMFADAIPQGQERGVFLHEVFHKRGRELMGEHYSRLKSFVDGWANAKVGTVEHEIYTAAKARADASGETGVRYDDELIAYSIEEAVNRGVETKVGDLGKTNAQGFMARVRQLFTNVMKKMHPSFNGKFTADDLVTIAHAAAGLEIQDSKQSPSLPTVAKNVSNTGTERMAESVSSAQSIQQRIMDFVARVRSNKGVQDSIDIAPVGSVAVAEARAHGLDIDGYTHMIDSSAVNHTVNKHGNEKNELSRGQLPITHGDFAVVSDVYDAPDTVVYGGKTDIGRDAIYYIKKISDGSIVVLEEVRTGKKKLALTSMRKYPSTVHATSILKSLNLNAQSDFDGDGISIVQNPKPRNNGTDVQFSKNNTDPKQGFENVPDESIAHEEKVYKEGKIFNQAGEWKLGKAAYDKLTDVAKSNYSPMSWLKFVSNKPALFTSIMHDYRAENTKFQRAAQDIANESKSFDAIERKVLKELLTNELEFDTVPPEHIVQVANEIRTLLNNQTDELVANGMLSRESAERWRESYLPRFYDKQADLFGGIKQGLNFIKSARAAMRMGMDGSHLKGRGIFKSVPKGSEAQYEAQGWEVRGQDSKGNPVVWRDYTKTERANMNENQDGIMSFTAGYMQTQADLAKARLFKRIAENDELASKTYRQDWVQVPDIPIADTGIRKFGALGGMFVHPEVYDHMKNEFGFANQGALLKTWRKALGYWKATKTVYNPVAHMNNMVSNVSMLWLAGGNPQDLVIGCRDLIKQQGYYDEAIDAGLIGDGVDSSAIRDMFGGVQNVKEHGAVMNYLAEKSANWHVLKPLTALKEAAEKAYRTEDEVFKFSLYTQQRNKGMSIENAREYANQFFFDYTDMPQGLRVLRDTGVLPFISYTSKAIPAIMRATLTRPHRMLAWVGAAHAINALSYMVLGAAGDEDEEKKNMPEYRQGAGLWGMPRQIRLPWNDDGKAAFIDITRMIPLGDFTDTTNQQGGLPLPNWMMPNGPVLGAISVFVMNKDPFTGDEFKKSYETVGDAKGKYAKWLLQQWLPSSVVVPFSYHTNNVLDGVKSQFENTWASDALEAIGYTGRKRSGDVVKLDDALRGSIGIKTWGFDPKQQAAKDMRRKQFEAREIKADMSSVRRDKSLTDEQRASKIEAQRKALERLFATIEQ